MSWASLLKIFSTAARSGGAKLGTSLGTALADGLKGLSAWISTWKAGNVLKIGGAGGIVAVVYSTWRSGISAVADATGLSEDTTATLIGLAFAALVLYVIVRLILPPKNGSSVNLYVPKDSGYDQDYYGNDWNGGRWR